MADNSILELTETKAGTEERLFDRYLGALLAAAITDALGWITEFRRSRSELSKMGLTEVTDFITWSKPTAGRFHTYIDYVSVGEYSDDTQLSLCTARSIEADGTFNAGHFAAELRAWLDYARGAGAAITAAARNLRQHPKVEWNDNFYGGSGSRRGYIDAGGNGAAMRVAPIALANRLDAERTALATWTNSIITHGHPRAIVGALTFVEALRVLAETTNLTAKEFTSHLLSHVSRITLPDLPTFGHWRMRWDREAGESFVTAVEKTKQEMLEQLQIGFDTKSPWERVLTDLGCFKAATKGSGTATVAAALSGYLRQPANYPEGALAIVNSFGIDTDTIGAMYGSLVGVRVGSLRIPDRWATKMQDYDYFLGEAEALSKIALRQTNSNPLQVDVSAVREREHDVVELTRARTVSKGQRVVHQLLGPGWVQGVNEQTIRSGGRMLLADVILDSNQSLRFRSFTPAAKRR